MNEMETLILGTILANQTVILAHLDTDKLSSKSEDILVAIETSNMVLDAIKKMVGKGDNK